MMMGSAGLSLALVPTERAHLNAVLGVGQRVLEGHFGQAQRLVAHAQAAAFIITNMAAGPLCGWPTRVPMAPSSAICAVALP